MMLIIDNYDSFTYNLYQLLSAYTDRIEVVRNDKISLAEIAKLKPEGIVLSPGPGRPETAGICIDLIKQFAPATPILGICLGLQAIVTAFGGKVVQAEKIMHARQSPVFHNRSTLFKHMPLPFQAGRYHSLLAEVPLPTVLELQAETEDEIIMAVKHKHYPTYGVQFHPESVLSEQGSQILSNFNRICTEAALC